MAVATQGNRTAAAIASVKVTLEAPDIVARLGIPEPTLVSAPDERWRSRLRGFRWEVNEAHPDYIAVRDQPKTRLRYLLSLLAKEIVIRTTASPELATPLESLIEVLAHAERNLSGYNPRS